MLNIVVTAAVVIATSLATLPLLMRSAENRPQPNASTASLPAGQSASDAHARSLPKRETAARPTIGVVRIAHEPEFTDLRETHAPTQPAGLAGAFIPLAAPDLALQRGGPRASHKPFGRA
jgi:hypothetical protein